MKQLVKEIRKVKERIEPEVIKRLEEFNSINKKGNDEWFLEICFCILAANTSSKMASRVTEAIPVSEFLKLPLKKLQLRMHKESCRFYNRRAEFIYEARKFAKIKDILSKFPNSFEKRDFLADNIKGVSFKEASHFLRNTGHYDVAILDKHVKNVLFESGLISKDLAEKNLTKTRYLEIESIFCVR
jgi:N-glycosylase/DNA lyase